MVSWLNLLRFHIIHHNSSWPKELEIHCKQEHQRQMTVVEASGELFTEDVRNANLASEIENYILGPDKENAPGMHINSESTVVNQSVSQSDGKTTLTRRVLRFKIITNNICYFS